MGNLLVVISGPSGGGKSSIIDEVLRIDNSTVRIPTYTTRPKRPGERDGQQHIYITQDEYNRLNSLNMLMAKSTVDGYSYGAPVIDMNSPDYKDRCLIMDMGLMGAREYKAKYTNAMFIYVIPPTIEQLVNQMKGRPPSRMYRNIAQISHIKNTCNFVIKNGSIEQAAREVVMLARTTKDFKSGNFMLNSDAADLFKRTSIRNKNNQDFLQSYYEKIDEVYEMDREEKIIERRKANEKIR